MKIINNLNNYNKILRIQKLNLKSRLKNMHHWNFNLAICNLLNKNNYNIQRMNLIIKMKRIKEKSKSISINQIICNWNKINY